VVVCGRDEARLNNALHVIGHGAEGFVCDVSTDAGGREFAEHAIATLGSVDILVANGGGPPPGGFAHTAEDQYLDALQKNLLSVVAMCQVAVPPMQQRGWGRVLAITSVSVRQPIANLILSNTARAGVTGFLKTLAREVAGDGKLGVLHGRSGGVERLAWRGCERGGGTQRMLFDFWQWFFGHVLSNVLLGLD
jgi:3-oxoacyl-[acyl-carrier protein] reductase